MSDIDWRDQLRAFLNSAKREPLNDMDEAVCSIALDLNIVEQDLSIEDFVAEIKSIIASSDNGFRLIRPMETCMKTDLDI